MVCAECLRSYLLCVDGNFPVQPAGKYLWFPSLKATKLKLVAFYLVKKRFAF